MYLLDTDVFSITSPASKLAGTKVDAWRSWVHLNEDYLYLSVITIMEIRFGIERLEAKGAVKKADLLRRWLSAAEIVYRSHVIPVAVEIAHRAGELLSQAVTDGARPTTEDALIAATADVKHLRLLSRNGKDMKALRVAWSDPLSSLPHGGSR